MRTARTIARFPFSGYPKGWFVVAFSADITRERVERLHYFGRDLIAYRGASGRAYVTDAYCPHLGAHLAHGGIVEGETIRCPFHGWRFENGRCVAIPYTDKIPPRARIESWTVCEQNGVVQVFFDPSGGAPWALPDLDESGWTRGRSVLWSALRTHPQEVFENTVDMAHIGPVHSGRGAKLIGKPERDGERFSVDLEFSAPGDIVGMPEQVNDVHLSVMLRGLGWSVVHTHVRNVDVRARQRIYATPVDEDTIDIRGIVHVRETDDSTFTAELERIFYDAYVEDFAKDFPIWENKRYLGRPMLANGDGPIGLYRRWCQQFYPAHGDDAPDVPLASLRSATSILRGGKPPQTPRFIATPRSASPSVLAMIRERTRGIASRLVSALRSKRVRSSGPTQSTTMSAPRTPRASIASVEEYFATLGDRFVPSAARGVDAVFQWELDGDGGGTFHAHVRNGRVDVRRGAHDEPGVCLAMSAEDYVRIVNGELDGMAAFTSGRSKVKGSLTLAMKMRSLFPA